MENERTSSSKISLVTIIFFLLFFACIVTFIIFYLKYGEEQKLLFHKEVASKSEKQNYYLGGQLPLLPGKVTKRTVMLFFIAKHKNNLISEQREITKQIDTISEIRETILELFLGSNSGLLSPIPAQTRLREIYVDLYQTVYIDVTKEIMDNHPGGVREEIFTVLSIIKSIRENFPHISRIQILVDGQEVETIAGHIMVNNPLSGEEFKVRTR